jgi:3'-5' exoribonuclease
MLGHIILGLEMVTQEISKIENFPHELSSLIKHLIISHHGEFEFGSPKIPATPEAMILHFADNIDAKLTTFAEIYEKDTTAGRWTTYQKSLGRYIRKPMGIK